MSNKLEEIPKGRYCYLPDNEKNKLRDKYNPTYYIKICPHFEYKKDNGVNVVHCAFLNEGGLINHMSGEDADKLVEKYGSNEKLWEKFPLDLLWEQYKRVIKDDGAILLFAQTPFDKVLGASNLEMLRYEWIWEKTNATGHLNAKRMPMKAHENILVFYKKLATSLRLKNVLRL